MTEENDITMEPEDGEGNQQSVQGKLKDLREELRKTKAERDEYLDSLQRMKADYINAKNRFEDERKMIGEYATERFAIALLPALDTFEQALQHDASDGMSRVHGQIVKILESQGIAAFSPEGHSFDPIKHESVEVLAVSDESLDNTVTKVHQKGYTLNGRIIRPARVAVGHYKN